MNDCFVFIKSIIIETLEIEDNKHKICYRCIKRKEFSCNNCKNIFKDTDGIIRYTSNLTYFDVFYCYTCSLNALNYCNICNLRCIDTQMIVLESKIKICYTCRNKYYVSCIHCESLLTKQIALKTRDICLKCLPLFSFCIYCGKGLKLVSKNIEENCNCNIYFDIYSHEYVPVNMKFIGKGKYYLGFELEFEYEEGCDISNTIIKNIYKSINKYFQQFIFIKRDGSLHNGIEVVSRPFSRNFWYFEGIKLFTKMLLTIKESGFLAYDNCGMHIHISNSGLNNLKLYKVMDLFYNNKDFSHLIANREGEWLERYASLDKSVSFNKHEREQQPNIIREYSQQHYYTSFSKELKKQNNELLIKTAKKDMNYIPNRYSAVNVTNKNTVELRLFKGTTSVKEFLKNIEVGFALVDYTNNISLSDISPASFLNFIKNNGKSYINLLKYLEKNDKKLL
jgi:hypothetical protein